MASLAVPLIEGVVVRVLAALGVGVVAGAAGEAAKEQARKRQEEADKAKSTPIARTDATTKERTKCKECPPDKGRTKERTFPVRQDWVDYQARVGGMPNGRLSSLNGNSTGENLTDSYLPSVYSKKPRVATTDSLMSGDDPRSWWAYQVDEMMDQMSRQSLAAMPRPPIRLRVLAGTA
jgi:hypothetical protein